MCKSKVYKPLITIEEKTDTSPAKFMELMTKEDAKVDENIYAILQVVIDEVL